MYFQDSDEWEEVTKESINKEQNDAVVVAARKENDDQEWRKVSDFFFASR